VNRRLRLRESTSDQTAAIDRLQKNLDQFSLLDVATGLHMLDPLTPPPSFLSLADECGIAFDEGDLDRLGSFLALLLDANTRFNLTAIRDPEEAWTKHILDSLTLLPLIAAAEAKGVIDVGSGAGLPGLPLAITMPDLAFTLLESTGKKARFIEETAAALGLDNVTVINDRAETVGRDRERHREQYDVVLGRAVGRLPVLLELTVPLATIGGLVLAIKGAAAEEEIRESKEALYRLHAHVIDRHRTPTGTIIVIRKMRRTPKLYPRKPGEPKRAPIGVAAAHKEDAP
jgi:16S rRNA (guanine527-N7)-methyltransferase